MPKKKQKMEIGFLQKLIPRIYASKQQEIQSIEAMKKKEPSAEEIRDAIINVTADQPQNIIFGGGARAGLKRRKKNGR